MGLFGPKKNTAKRSVSYYDRENLVHTISDIIKIYNPENVQVYKSNNIVKYNSVDLRSLNSRELSSTFGDANLIIKKIPTLPDYEVHFYYHEGEKYNYLMQFHFCKNNFLFVNNMVRASYVLSTTEKKAFINRIVKKYFNDLNIDFDKGLDLKIIGKEQNFLYINDGVNFSVSYIYNSDKLKKIVGGNKINKSDKIGDIDTDLF